MSVGERIKMARTSTGYSQKALAEAIDSAENTIAGWENGRNAPPGDKVAAMARTFKCSTDAILLDESDRNESSEMTALLRRFEGLPDSRKALA